MPVSGSRYPTLTGALGEGLGLAVPPPLLEQAAAMAEQATSAVTARLCRKCGGRKRGGRRCGGHKREAGPPSRVIPATMSDVRPMATSPDESPLMQSRRHRATPAGDYIVIIT